MYIPVFEIKDSFIIKNVLQYDTSCNLDLPYKMMFTDYDLARKSQTTNAENFSEVTLDADLSSEPTINITYFDKTYTIYTNGDLIDEDVFSGTTVTNNKKYQQYNVPDGSLYGINERVNIDIYQKEAESGTTFWEYTSYIPNDVWVISGATSLGTQWTVSGSTTSIGYYSGYTNWYVNDITPVLTYIADILNTGSTYIRIDKKLEDYLYNNLIKNYDNLYYKITGINHSNNNYIDLYEKLLLLEISPNFDINIDLTSITMIPKYNESDIYFDYDALYIDLSGVTGYTFDTDCLYNKYNLELLFDQIDVSGGTNIYQAAVTNILSTSYVYHDYYMTFEVYNPTIFIEYTYVIISGGGNSYNVLITGIDLENNTITVISPYNLLSSDSFYLITNLRTVTDISNVLQKTYENYNQDEYNKLPIETRKNIYNAYGEIINQAEYNQEFRLLLSGLIFENSNKIMVLKIFDPADFVDDRLLYEPIEIVRIGKDRKTTIPVPIKEFTKGLAADVNDT